MMVWERIDGLLQLALRRPGRISLALFAMAMLVRAGLALWLPDAILWIDGQRYVKIAESLLAGQGFGTLEMNKISVPTQPLLIAAFLAAGGGSYTVVRLGFVGLGAATCVLAYHLGRSLFGPRAGLVAGLILAFYPLHAYTSALFEVPQTFFMLAVAGAFLCLFRFFRTRHGGSLWGAGVLFGLSALSVPTVIPFFLAVPIWLAVVEARPRAWLRQAAVFTFGILLAISPWVIRNYIAYERLIVVNLAGGENFRKANSVVYFEHGKRAAALPCECGTGGEDYCAELARVQADTARMGLSENEAIVYADQAGWHGGVGFIRDDPLRFVRLTGRKLASLLSPVPDAVSSASEQGGPLQVLVSVLTYLPILLLGIVGVIRTRGRWRRLFPVYAYLLTLIGLYSVFVPTVRYRLPVDFFLILFTADWLVYALDRGRHRVSSRLLPS